MPVFESIYDGLPSDLFHFWRRLHPHPRYGFLFGSSKVYLSAGEPSALFETHRRGRQTLNRIHQQVRSGGSAHPRFVGALSFEAGRDFDRGIERLPKRGNPLNTPTVSFADYPALVCCDKEKNQTVLIFRGTSAQEPLVRIRFEKIFFKSPKFHREKLRISHEKFSIPSAQHFAAMVKEAKNAISRGDIYQANLSLRLERSFRGDPIEFYRVLCARNPSPYQGLFKLGNFWLASSSPELLMALQGRKVMTRPIAGTRPRGKTSQTDKTKEGQLLLSPKERAEHMMLVDLERNDLGRVCRPGSVRVTERMTVEKYSHVMHIVSQVEGHLSAGKTFLHALEAVFPGGTITGCPKIKAIELIEAIEGTSRSFFYGSAGYVADNGDAVFNILIRTGLIKDKKLMLQVGAGIVADSNPAREYKEVLAKGHALVEAAGGKI